MVRLKVGGVGGGACESEMFQFQYGSIKRQQFIDERDFHNAVSIPVWFD